MALEKQTRKQKTDSRGILSKCRVVNSWWCTS